MSSGRRISLREQALCLRDELRRRVEAYPGLVQRGKLSQQQADSELMRMRHAYRTLRDLAAVDALVPVRVGSRPEERPPFSGHDDQND